VVALGTAGAAGSIALVGFGLDSAIEETASVAAFWRVRREADGARRERAERGAVRVIGLCFLGLAAFVGFGATTALAAGAEPEVSAAGLILAAASRVLMPWLARRKRKVARALIARDGSEAGRECTACS
jgi:divalent metal cation (Fe/Co/Zn/Cd) transporter